MMILLLFLQKQNLPDLAHAVSVLGRYVHNPSQKLWLAYHRIAKYLIRTKDFRLILEERQRESCLRHAMRCCCRQVRALVQRQLLGRTRIGRCHGLREELALTFAMEAGLRCGVGGRGSGSGVHVHGDAGGSGEEGGGSMWMEAGRKS
jgi:hypothetical protein